MRAGPFQVVLTVAGIVAGAVLTANAQPFSETTVHAFNPYPGGGVPGAAVIQASDGNLYGVTSFGGEIGQGTIFRIGNLAGSPTFTVLYNFTGGPDGGIPDAALVEGSDGTLYGTTSRGGSAGVGTVFRISNLAGTPSESVLYSFLGGTDGSVPQASLIQALDGNLYGTTEYGGSANAGTVFRIANLSGTPTESILWSFAGGPAADGYPQSSLIQASDGNLYGTTPGNGATNSFGTVFKVANPGGIPAVTVIHQFGPSDGEVPLASLVQASDGNLYGTTDRGGASGAGAVFRIGNLSGTPTESLLYSFSGSADGGYPGAALIQASDGNLYGTTSRGGSAGVGAVFAVGNLAGTPTFGVIYSFFGGADGGYPEAAVIQASDGNLYGTATTGGTSGAGAGAVFAIGNLAGSPTESVIHGFPAGADGSAAAASLVQASDHNLYGTTSFGGASGAGTVFRIANLAGAPTESVLYSFTGGPDGGYPYGGLIQASDGSLYGTTQYGGATGSGSVFRISNLSGTPAESVVHSFAGGADGAYPYASLIQAADGNLYGTTYWGGASNFGTVFVVGSPAGTPTFSVIYSFTGGDDGGHPNASLIQASDGALYGTTYFGGANGAGAVFKIANLGGTPTESVAYTFTGGADGGNPYAGLIQATDGNLYGTSQIPGGGTVYRISNLAGSPAFGVVYSFAGAGDGAVPRAALIQASDGNLYGTTSAGGVSGFGTVFTIANLGGVANESVVYSFSGRMDGGAPEASLIEASDGNLYGTTPSQGRGNSGTVFGLVRSCFSDVPALSPFRSFICTIARDGVTAGCGAGNFCPSDSVLRSQMAVFLLRAEHGESYVPPACTGIFADVPCPGAFTDWIEELHNEGITGGCAANPLTYCPGGLVTRASMAVMLLRGKNGSAYTPPACSGIFADVPCPGAFTDWIEELYSAGITGGCGANPLAYCPGGSVTRAQMAVFLVGTFGLP